jgi:hypothetical protein
LTGKGDWQTAKFQVYRSGGLPGEDTCVTPFSPEPEKGRQPTAAGHVPEPIPGTLQWGTLGLVRAVVAVLYLYH